MDENNIIKGKTKSFAIRIINLYKYLTINAPQKEYVLSKQVLRSGTSIGANVKEASETEYWLELLEETDYISKDSFDSIISDNLEIIKILTTIVKNSQD